MGVESLGIFFPLHYSLAESLRLSKAYAVTPHHHEFAISYYIAEAIDRAGLSPLSRLLQSACLATRDSSCSDNASPCFLK